MRFDPLFEPISDDQPCGPDLEADGDDAFVDYYYDALARLPERYIDTSTGETFDKKAVDLKAEVKAMAELLQRSRDLRLLVLEAQFQVLAGQLGGFAECVEAIARLLEDQWDEVHPRPGDDPTDRRNTLELLASRATIVMPLEGVQLIRDRRLEGIQWRDYAVGAGKRPARDEKDGGDAAAILSAMGSSENADAVGKAYEALQTVAGGLTRIGNSCKAAPQAFSPNLAATQEVVAEILALFTEARPDLAGDAPEAEKAADEPGEEGAAAPRTAGPSGPAPRIASHAAAKTALGVVEAYFAENEPSAPTYLLVRQARMLIGRPLVEALELLLPEMAESAKIDFGSGSGFVIPMARMRSLSEALQANGGGEEIGPSNFQASTRDQAASLMSSVEAFFRQAEPSSPIPVLLFKAKTYLNRDFAAIIGEMLPPKQE